MDPNSLENSSKMIYVPVETNNEIYTSTRTMFYSI